MKVVLNGCSSEQLIQYLKALGIFKILATQNELEMKGYWENGFFTLETSMSQREIIEFFLNQYAPSPLVAPWNGGSGFYGKSAEQYLTSIENSTVERLELYRRTIKECRALLEEFNISDKIEDSKIKNQLRLKARQMLNDDALAVMDSLFILQTNPLKSGDVEARFLSLFGTGGNDGNLEFTNTFMNYLGKIIDFGVDTDKKTQDELSKSRSRLNSSLFKGEQAAALSGSVGQFFPGGAGGVNLSVGFSGDSLINPWDYVLALEGVLVFRGRSVRQLDRDVGAKAAFPFTVAETAAGWGTISKSDEGNNSHAETWLPVWEKPASYRSISYLFAEGRVKVDKRKATNGLDFARAVASLGVDRGIDSFERVGFFSGQRFGKMYFAVNLGNFPVKYRQNVRLLDSIDEWLFRWRNFASRKETPSRYSRILQNMENAIFRYTQFGRTEDLTAILISLGAAEENLRYLIGKEVPCNPLCLDPKWVDASDDGSVEFRLAASLASILEVELDGKVLVSAIRAFWEPVEKHKKRKDYVWSNDIKQQGSTFDEKMLYVLERRLLIAKKHNLVHWPLKAKYFVTINDIEMFLNGLINMEKLEKLFKGLMLVNWSSYRQSDIEDLPYKTIDPAYAVLKLVYWPNDLVLKGQSYRVGKDYSSITYLRSGDLKRALQKSLHRLQATDLDPKIFANEITSYPSTYQRCVRLGAALLFSLRRYDVNHLARRILKETREDVMA